MLTKLKRCEKSRLILMNQTHSNKVTEIKKENYKRKINADAMITSIKGLGLAVVTADCVPIIIYDYKNEVIGCIHAGWKGAFSGIIKNTINKIERLNSKSKIIASIGPCIGKNSYEVDLPFYKKFVLSHLLLLLMCLAWIVAKRSKKFGLNGHKVKRRP